MKKTLKEFVVEYNTDHGYSNDNDEGLYETLVESVSERVWTGDADRHRWFTLYPVIVKVIIDKEERFFHDMLVDVHGENSDREECGLTVPDLDDLTEVFPKEVTTTIYVTADKL